MWVCLGCENQGRKGLLCKPYSSDKEALKEQTRWMKVGMRWELIRV